MIGILGGTFDPVHFGHLRPALEVMQALGLEQVRFLPNRIPPHRETPWLDVAHRLELLQTAIEDQDGFVLDERELGREGRSYMVDTLDSLRRDFPAQPLCLILGMDAFLGLPRWHRWTEILNLAHIVVAHRPGWKAPDIGPLGEMITATGTHRVQDLHDATHGRLHIHAVTQLEISSTEIRDLIAAGRDPRFLMPDAVRDVIAGNRCYGELDETMLGRRN